MFSSNSYSLNINLFCESFMYLSQTAAANVVVMEAFNSCKPTEELIDLAAANDVELL